MPRTDLEIGDRVFLYSFGVHPAVVTGFAPTVTIQGRTVIAEDWITVRTDAGLVWNGTTDHLRRTAPRVRKAA